VTQIFSAHSQLLDSVVLSPIASVISNPRRADNPIEIVNPAFCQLTGYTEEEVVGRNCRFLAGVGTEPWVTDEIKAGIRDRRPVLVEILNYRKDGTPFRNGVTIIPLFDGHGELEWFLGSQVDLGEGESLLAARRARAAAKVKELSPRQRQILSVMSHGLLNKQIAHRLGIAEKTVKMHRALLLDRLGIATSAEAIRIAVEAGL
jgi:PAS domain S-box-containing protein